MADRTDPRIRRLRNLTESEYLELERRVQRQRRRDRIRRNCLILVTGNLIMVITLIQLPMSMLKDLGYFSIDWKLPFLVQHPPRIRRGLLD